MEVELLLRVALNAGRSRARVWGLAIVCVPQNGDEDLVGRQARRLSLSSASLLLRQRSRDDDGGIRGRRWESQGGLIHC